MKVYIVTMVTEEEYCGRENMHVFANKEDAEAYVAERQDTFEHWSGNEVNLYDIEEWKVE